MLEKIGEAAQKVWELLPKDPFSAWLDEAEQYIQGSEWVGYLNYFVPVGTLVDIGTAWLAAVAVYILVRKIRAAIFGKG
ncbi:MAG: hypothetical protein J6K58_04805 [Lachnospiraceae bacterium]|nr:hypothetical protein [Lachnospiraceae bacterium]